MFRIRAVAVVVGILLLQIVAIKAEEDLRTQFSQLESQFKEMTQRLQHTEAKVSGLQEQVELLKRQQENVTDMQLENRDSRFRYVGDKFRHNGRGRREVLAPYRRYPRSINPSSNPDPDEVAFSVELTNELTNVPVHTTIKFDNEIHWTDNSYDPATGVFTCPTSGLYLFAVFIEAKYTGVESMVNLMLDGKSYMSVISEQMNDGEDDTGGNVVLLSVNKGQRVWVETYNSDNQSFWLFTTFSGVLIHRH